MDISLDLSISMNYYDVGESQKASCGCGNISEAGFISVKISYHLCIWIVDVESCHALILELRLMKQAVLNQTALKLILTLLIHD
jgi:hypothetical protein